MEDMLDFLDDYFQKTPKDVIKAKFDKYNQAKYEGVTVKQYLQNFATNHNFLPSLENINKEQVQTIAEQEQKTYSSAA
ncbi:MAG: hypothetical protein EAZ95_11240 [Bacteroidetes bacterium]|nr:MAG: hypothetical protein EAZ95_11240 [Bacteroidota bacterium]